MWIVKTPKAAGTDDSILIENRVLRVLTSIFLHVGVLPFLLVLAIAIFSIATDNFLSKQNLLSVSRQSTYLITVSIGQMVVLLTAGLDLSVGIIIAMCSVTSSLVMTLLWSGVGPGWDAIILGCLAGLATSIAIGIVNGIGVAYLRVAPFVMTLAMSSIVFGLALTLTGGTPVYGMPEVFADTIGYGQVLSVPVPVWITAASIGLMYVIMSWTPMGRYLYAIGGNVRAAELSGINTRVYTFFAYVISSLMAGIAALMLTARLESGESNIGSDYPLLSIAACAIGGVSLQGGVGKLSNVVFAAFFIILVQNGMNLLRVNSYLQMVAIGALLITAVIFDNLRVKLVHILRK